MTRFKIAKNALWIGVQDCPVAHVRHIPNRDRGLGALGFRRHGIQYNYAVLHSTAYHRAVIFGRMLWHNTSMGPRSFNRGRGAISAEKPHRETRFNGDLAIGLPVFAVLINILMGVLFGQFGCDGNAVVRPCTSSRVQSFGR